MLNRWQGIGNLGRDPETRDSNAGNPITNFSIACTRKWRDSNGNSQEETEWANIVCFGKNAEIAGEYLTKGRQVYVEGRLKTSSWDDKETGAKRYKTEIICDRFQMLGKRDDAPQQGGGASDADVPF